ncbi:ABC transporter G family member 31 [Phytophthora citrophthora]|uniref:ABC transporter G family member 31 n=1 Tax=Phytophthora citrophthora TaxID=4793 RepID=A0AAD9LAD8_9STRA|nr:ABC transporter G family member 31 [Phytophthora citrophthora]
MADLQDTTKSDHDVVPDKLLTPKVSTYRLPRFSSRRLTPQSSLGSYNQLPRTQSMFPEPRQLTNDDLTSADAFMADDVFTMNSTLSTVIENALGRPIPGLEIRFRDLQLSAEVPLLKPGSLEVPTLWSQLQLGLSSIFSSKAKKLTVDKKILRGITGIFRPGRITLVLGQPGSGKSSFMKVLADRFHMDKNISLSGDVTYNGKDRAQILDTLHQDVAYVNQIDEHYPRLTVQETFEFAHQCCAGKELEPWVVEALKNSIPEQEELAVKVMTAHHKFTPDLMVKKLGLDNCKDTIVGDAMLRGVSGGERKRVTTGEMLVSKKRLQLLDEISTGLDSAATYDICKSLKSAARNFNVTVVVSLLQPSPEVFELFDDVFLMHGGSVMFHGKCEDVVPYFERMGFNCPPRKDVADFLLDLGTNKQDAYVVGGPGSVPTQSAEFAERFRESTTFQSTLKRLDSPVKDQLDIRDAQPFRLTLVEEVATLLHRELKLKSRDTAYLVGRAVMVIVMGLLYGSTFWQMDDANSQLVLGLLFSCALFVALSQSSQVPTFMEARSVFYKQRGANFFRSSSYVLAISLSQIPMAILETVVFGSITYWMGGYVDAVDRFVVFVVTLFLCQTWYTSFFFFLSSVSPNLTMAQPFMMVCVLFSMLFGGFLIAKEGIPDYLIWIYWMDPLAWGIRALSVNEYLAPKFDVCVYQSIDYCEKFNQTVGEYSLGVFNLPTESMWVWYGWIYLIAGYFALIFTSYMVLEYKRFESPENVAMVADGEDQTVYSEMPSTPKVSKEDDRVIEIHNVDDIMGGVPTISIPVQPTGRGIAIPVTLAFHDLWYSVPLPGATNDEQIDLLKGVSGFALPGTMTALMGSSGAGKTTLMDVIAGRKTGGKIQGKILLNGHAANDLAIRRCTGYCEQMDIHSDSATVREALVFSAMLRQDASIPTAQKMESVDECIELLELGPIADKIIRGSSTEQMKRVTIGVELAAQPSIIFMDEPTSGLDARSAKLIMNGVRKIADSGRTIVCTIHQPSTEVFNLFDSLLLLRRGGRMVFFGELGEDSKNLINYFESFEDVTPIKTCYNPATWMLECIGAGVGGGHADAGAQPLDFAERFLASDQRLLMEEDLEQEGILLPSPHLPELKFDRKRASNPYSQFELLCLRFFRMYWRTPTYNLTRLFISVVLASVFAIIYQGTDYTTYSGANTGVGLIFVSTVFFGIISFNSVMPVVADERTAFYRERASETYNALWYFIAGTLAEIPYVFLSCLLFCIIFFPSVGFTGYSTFFYYWLVLSLNTLVFVYLGQLLVYALPSVAVATTLGALLSSIFILFGGFNPPAGTIPTGYKWVHWISPTTYTVAVLVALIFADCSGDASGGGDSCELVRNAPPTIGQVTVKTYVENSFDMKHEDIVRNVGVLVALMVAFRGLALVALRYINHLKR